MVGIARNRPSASKIRQNVYGIYTTNTVYHMYSKYGTGDFRLAREDFVMRKSDRYIVNVRHDDITVSDSVLSTHPTRIN